MNGLRSFPSSLAGEGGKPPSDGKPGEGEIELDAASTLAFSPLTSHGGLKSPRAISLQGESGTFVDGSSERGPRVPSSPA